MNLTFKTCSEAETSAFGRFLGELLQGPITVLLEGDLGAGKSVLARALARGLGVAEDIPITSPTFTLMNHYTARLELYHFDLYRLSDAEELIEIGFDDFAHSQGVALIEWPERLDDRSFDHLLLRIERISAECRKIEASVCGEKLQSLLNRLNDWKV